MIRPAHRLLGAVQNEEARVERLVGALEATFRTHMLRRVSPIAEGVVVVAPVPELTGSVAS